MADLRAALEGIERFIEDRLARSNAPGVVVALTDRERLLGGVAVGLADVAAGRPVELEDRFQIGSISKSFAAIDRHAGGRGRAARPAGPGDRLRALVRGALALRADHAASSADPHRRPHHGHRLRPRRRAPGLGAAGDGVRSIARRALLLLQRRLQAARPGARGDRRQAVHRAAGRAPAGAAGHAATATRRSRWRHERRSPCRISASSTTGRATRGSPGWSVPGTRRRPPTAASSRRPPTCAPTRACLLARGDAPVGTPALRGELDDG